MRCRPILRHQGARQPPTADFQHGCGKQVFDPGGGIRAPEQQRHHCIDDGDGQIGLHGIRKTIGSPPPRMLTGRNHPDLIAPGIGANRDGHRIRLRRKAASTIDTCSRPSTRICSASVRSSSIRSSGAACFPSASMTRYKERPREPRGPVFTPGAEQTQWRLARRRLEHC